MSNLSDPHQGAAKHLPSLLLVLLCFGLYAGSLSAPWHLDDWSFIVSDPAIQQLWPIHGHANRPVLTFSLALNNALCGLDPACFRFVNVAIHACTALLIFGLLQRLLRSGRLGEKAAASAQWLAFSMAALWMAHPINTMAVTYVWQRSESLMGLFFVAVLYAIQRCAGGTRGKAWGTLAVVLCLLGVGTKEVMVAVIPVALLFDAVLLASSLREALRRRWALHGTLFVILIALLTLVAPRTSTSLGEIGRWTYAGSQPGVVLDYMRLSILPWPLCFDYDRAPAHGMIEILLPTLFIAAALGATLWGLIRRSWMGVAGALFFLVLAPTSSIVEINDLMVEYRLYLPLIAPVILLTALARFAWDRWNPPLPIGALFLLVLSLLSLATITRNKDYSSNVRLWSSVLEVAPENARAANSLAASFLTVNQPRKAIEPARRATELKSKFYSAHVNLGTALKLSGDMHGAFEAFKSANKIRPNADSRYRLGKILLDLELPGKAGWQFYQALIAKPDMLEARMGLAQARVAKGDFEGAKKALRRIVKKNPDQGQAWFLLGVVCMELKLPERAAEAFEHAVEFDDQQLMAWTHLAKLSVELRRPERGAQAYGQVTKLDPSNIEMQFNHGRLLVVAGKPKEAERVLKAMLRNKPSTARQVAGLASKLARGDSVNKKTARVLAQLATEASKRADHVTLLHLARVLVFTGDSWKGVGIIDEILTLPTVRSDSKLTSAYTRERQALEKFIQKQ